MRECSGCGRSYQPSSRHRLCPACRSKDRCARGNIKQKKSSTCSHCHISPSGPLNGHWRGGRVRNKAGYVMVNLPSHPRARSAGQYVFEHILVMEDHIGRHLTPDENVHHLNGVKDDNRIENLELWVKPQPSGIRARDALAWALDIVARYEPMVDLLN